MRFEYAAANGTFVFFFCTAVNRSGNSGKQHCCRYDEKYDYNITPLINDIFREPRPSPPTAEFFFFALIFELAGFNVEAGAYLCAVPDAEDDRVESKENKIYRDRKDDF